MLSLVGAVTVLAVEPLTEGLHAMLEGPRTLKAGEASAVRLAGLEGVFFEEKTLRARVTTDEPGASPIELELTIAPSKWEEISGADRRALRERGEQLRATSRNRKLSRQKLPPATATRIAIAEASAVGAVLTVGFSQAVILKRVPKYTTTVAARRR